MAAAKKSASKHAVEPMAIEPQETKATREKDKEEKAPVFRVDLGQSLSTQPFPTATDHE